MGKISCIIHDCLTTLFVGGTTLRGRTGIVNRKGRGRKRSWPNLKLGTFLEKLNKTTKNVSPFVRLWGEICNRYLANMEQEYYPLEGDFRTWGRTFLIVQINTILRSNIHAQIWAPLICDICCHTCFSVICV